MFYTDPFHVTDIQPPFTVHSAKGRLFETQNRPWCGLSLCISGQITYSMNGEQYLSVPGVAVFLPKGGRYSLHGDEEGLFPVINFQTDLELSPTIMTFPLSDPAGCLELFDQIRQLCSAAENRLKVYSLFYELLHQAFFSQMIRQNPLSPMIRYLNENLRDPSLTNTVLAKRLHISEVYLRKLFRQHYNTTPKQYLLDIRISRSKQLLSDTDLSVTEIAEQCGFSSVYHFCRAFRLRTGLTPSQYADSHKTYLI